jgi:hypothetical protein
MHKSTEGYDKEEEKCNLPKFLTETQIAGG